MGAIERANGGTAKYFSIRKHIYIRHIYVAFIIVKREIVLKHISTTSVNADLLTELLGLKLV